MSTHNHLIMTNLDQEIRLRMFSANAEALVDVPFGGSLRAGFPSITLLKPLTWEKFSFVITKPPFMPV